MAASKKVTVKKSDTPAWKVIHVFGYGETQIIGSGANGKVPNENIKALDPLLSYIAGIQNKNSKIDIDNLRALNIINQSFVDYLPKPGKAKMQRFQWDELDPKTIDKVAAELMNKVAAQEKKNTPVKKKAAVKK